jgi:hypothetical protein
MNEAQFWRILERAKVQSNGDLYKQHELIANSLAELEVSEILEFDQIYYEKDVFCYTAKLGDVAQILMRGCGDDSFMDFRDWLISQGEEIYYYALKDPDSLANVIDLDAGKFKYLESIMFSAVESGNEMKTGQEEMPPYLKSYKYELKGEFCPREEYKDKYPKLTAISRRWYGNWI